MTIGGDDASTMELSSFVGGASSAGLSTLKASTSWCFAFAQDIGKHASIATPKAFMMRGH